MHKPLLTFIFLWYEQYKNTNKLGQFSIAQYIDVQCSLQVHKLYRVRCSYFPFFFLGLFQVKSSVKDMASTCTSQQCFHKSVFFPISIPPTVALLSIFKARSSSERSGKCWRKTARECSCKCEKNS